MSAGKIIRMSIRHVTPMMEFRVKEIMSSVESRVRRTAGLQRIETLVDRNDPNRYLVVTEWDSREALNRWLSSDLCKSVVAELNTVLDKSVEYSEFVRFAASSRARLPRRQLCRRTD